MLYKIVFVVGNTTLSAADQVLLAILRTALRADVVVISDLAAVPSLTDVDAILISETCTSTNLGTRYRNVPVHVVIMENAAWDQMDMASTQSSTALITTGTILSTSHPISDGMTGTINLLTTATSLRYATTANLAASASSFLSVGGNTSQVIGFTYSAGQTMLNSHVAEASRVGLGFHSDSYPHFTSEAYDIVVNSLLWGMGGIPARDKSALIVIGGTLNHSERCVRSRLRMTGHNVLFMQASNVTTADADLRDVVIMSKTVESTTVGTKLKATTSPVVFWEDNQQQLSMLATIDNSNVTGTAWHATGAQISINGSVDASLRGGLAAGSNTFYHSIGEITYAPESDSGAQTLIPDAIRIAEFGATGDGRWAVYAIPAGATLADGTIAAGPRSFFGLYDDTFKNLSATAVGIFDGLVAYGEEVSGESGSGVYVMRDGALLPVTIHKASGLEVESPDFRAIYRINAGGPAISADPVWETDTQSAPSQYVSGVTTQSATTTNAITLDSSVPAGTPASMFQSERYDSDQATRMTYTFPVAADAQHLVRLYFAEIFTGAQAVGARVMDAYINGQQALDNYDTFAEVGGYTGQCKEFAVNTGVAETQLVVEIGPNTIQSPRIMGIEIMSSAPRPVSSGGTGGIGGGSSEVLHVDFENWTDGDYTQARTVADFVTPVNGRLLSWNVPNGQLSPVIRTLSGGKVLVARFAANNRYQLDFNSTLGPGRGVDYQELWWTMRIMWADGFMFKKPSDRTQGSWVGKTPHLVGSPNDDVLHTLSGSEDVQSLGLMWRDDVYAKNPSTDMGTYYEGPLDSQSGGSGHYSNLVMYPYCRGPGDYEFRPEYGVKLDLQQSGHNLLQSGRWYTIQHHVVMNTPGSADGYWELYIDGVLRGRRTQGRFRLAGQDFGWNKIRWSNFFGGTSDQYDSHPQYEEILFDYVNISETNPFAKTEEPVGTVLWDMNLNQWSSGQLTRARLESTGLYCRWGTAHEDRSAIINDPFANSGEKVLEVRHQQQVSTTSLQNDSFNFTAWLPEVATGDSRIVEYDLAFGANFEFNNETRTATNGWGGKLPGLAANGPYGSENISPHSCQSTDGGAHGEVNGINGGWSMRHMWHQPQKTGGRDNGVGGPLVLYSYWKDKGSSCGDDYGLGVPPLESQRWYKIRQQIDVNTLGQANGRVRVWIDGVQRLDLGGLELRTADYNVNQIKFHTYFGGATPDWGHTLQEERTYYRNVRVLAP